MDNFPIVKPYLFKNKYMKLCNPIAAATAFKVVEIWKYDNSLLILWKVSIMEEKQ